jgi:hypothetical protein
MPSDLFQTLRQEHREVRQIFEQLIDEEESTKRKKLLQQLEQEIVPHMKGEEKAFYSKLAAEERSKEHALEGFEEHHAAELVLGELKKTPPSDERFRAKVTVLHEMIEHHIQEEEKELFKDARRVMSKEQISQVLEQFMKEKERVKKGMA